MFFDEYIRLKDFRKQLVVSPPIEKSLYSISPQSGASKYIQIDINETLPKNTTYVFNFGQSVVDNNEGNILPYFKYVFSTGDYIDSLKISGNITEIISWISKNEKKCKQWAVNEYINNPMLFYINGERPSGKIYDDKSGRKNIIRVCILKIFNNLEYIKRSLLMDKLFNN